VNVSIIDEEHKKLIDIINKAISAKQYDNNPRSISEILVEMTVYAKEHFKTEETYMSNFKYHDYKSHKDEHQNFSKNISAYCNDLMSGSYQIMEELTKYLQQWLVHHIQETDKKYTYCFNKNGLK
jgi:hemerythrin-like metal-binding protein